MKKAVDHDSDPLRLALAVAREALVGLYGERLVKVFLFGSQARGEATGDSDVDVLLVLRGGVDYAAEVDRFIDLELDLLERFRQVFSFIPMSEETFADTTHPLVRSVRQEGVLV